MAAARARCSLGALALRLSALATGCRTSTTPTRTRTSCRGRSGCSGTPTTRTTSSTRPRFTYLLHVVFWARWGGDGVQARLRRRPGRRLRWSRAWSARVLGTVAVGLLCLGRRRGCSTAGRACSRRRCWPSRSCRSTTRTSRSTTSRRSRRCASRSSASPGVLRRGEPDRLRAGGRRPRARVRDEVHGRDRAAVALIAAALVARRARGRPDRCARRSRLLGCVRRARGLPRRQPVRAARLRHVPDGLREQSAASSDGGGKLGLTEDERHRLLPALARLGPRAGPGARGGSPARPAAGAAPPRGARSCSCPGRCVFLLFMGSQDRFFARWLLPVYPLLCLLAAYGALVAAVGPRAARRARRWRARRWPSWLLCGAGLRLLASTTTVVARARRHPRARCATGWSPTSREGSKIVVEPIAPDQWATTPAPVARHRQRRPLDQVAHLALTRQQRRDAARAAASAAWSSSRTTSARPAPSCVDSYARGGFCWVVTGSTQFGRAYAEPEEVPQAMRYYDELRRRGEARLRGHARTTTGARACRSPSTTRFNAYPLAYQRPGPEIVVYRLHEADCA